MAEEYNRERWQQAYHAFCTDPKTLTDEDLAQLGATSSDFEAHARSLRAGVVEPMTPIMQTVVKRWELSMVLDDIVWPILSTYRAKMTQLEARIAQLETRPTGVKYCGTWQAKAYAAGDLVTRGGSLWVATAATTHTPGQGAGWQLIVKKGQA